MKYKFAILTVICILLSGCSGTYSIEISNEDSSIEKFTTSDYSKYYSKEDMQEIIPDLIIGDSDILYDFDENDNLVITRYKDDYKELNNDIEIDNNFGKIEISNKKISFKPNYDKCIFMFLDGGEYVTNDKIKVNVALPFKVSKSNADNVDGNIYTWTYGINDCDKEAYVKIKSSNIIIYVIIGIILIGAVICMIIKRRKNNDIN